MSTTIYYSLVVPTPIGIKFLMNNLFLVAGVGFEPTTFGL
ncbi:hypothetical protein CARN8_2510004 [mine drainage metagenome]|uniref:Uncharacterized protein n=1 Tax=mine drainage metagenome TaxID=410659 RepID=A0A3P3ZN41_9ZZZZ